MNRKSKVNQHWPQIAAICLAFFCFLGAKDANAIGLPPLITVPPLGATVRNGDSVTLTATVGASLTPLTITWYQDGTALKNAAITNISVPIVGTTISTLTIPKATPSKGGNYWIKAENGGGEVRSAYALLIVLNPNQVAPVLTSQCGPTNGGFLLNVVNLTTSNCVIEASLDCSHWTPLYTNSNGSTNINYVDAAATNLTYRYYRARLQ